MGTAAEPQDQSEGPERIQSRIKIKKKQQQPCVRTLSNNQGMNDSGSESI